MTNQLIPERLKSARESLGISMAEAARRLNLSKIGYCRYEYGDRTPSPQTVEVIARVLGTSVAYLTGKSEDMKPDFIMISKKEAPELFELIETLSTYDSATQKRLLAYAQKLNSKQIRTTGLAGGLFWPYKGLLPALSLKTRRMVRQPQHHFSTEPPGLFFICFALPAPP